MEFKASPYRWVVLAVFAFVNLTIQILWISYAPIAQIAAEFYRVGDLEIGFFAMSFMIAFVPLSIPVSWLIDRLGYRFAVGIGVIVMGAAGVLRGFAGDNFALAMLCTVFLAASQPFLLNAWTSVPAKWFPSAQRATAVGIITLGNLIGTAVGMVVPPLLAEGGMNPGSMQLVFGIIAAGSAVLFLCFAREKPAVPPSADAQEARALVLDGIKIALTSRDFWFSLAVAFIGLGVFNGITTWIEPIVRPRGFGPAVAGTCGALMLAGGLVGALVIPALSDRARRRRPFLIVSLAFTIPGILGLALAGSVPVLYGSAVVLGFFLVSALPVAMQYAAEITRPTPEGTSNGLIQLAGQGAVVFVYAMAALKAADGSFTLPLLLCCALLAAGTVFVLGMRESKP